MATAKASYWLALGVLVLALNSEYQRGGLQPVHRIVNSSMATANCVAVSAQQYIALAKMLVGRSHQTPSPEFWASIQEARQMEHEVARVNRDAVRQQINLVQAQVRTEMARHRGEFARLQAQRARMAAIATKVRPVGACDKGEVHVMVDADNEPVIADLEISDEN